MKRRVVIYRWYAFIVSVCVTYILGGVFGILGEVQKQIGFLVAAGIVLVVMGSLRVKKNSYFSGAKCSCEWEEYPEVIKLVSLYRRKMIVSFILCFGLMAVATVGNGWFALAGIFLGCNNGIKQQLWSKQVSDCMKSSFSIYVRKLCLRSFCYWAMGFCVICLGYLVHINTTRLTQAAIVMAGIYLIAFLTYFLKERNRYLAVVTRIDFVKKFIVAAIVFGVFMFVGMEKGCLMLEVQVAKTNPVSHREIPIEYDVKTGAYTIGMDGEELKILHLTDLHIGGSIFTYQRDMKALHAIYALVEHTKPDLIIVTGDLVYPIGLQSLALNNETAMMQVAEFFEKMGVPWAFTFGNHDTEAVAKVSTEGLRALLKEFSYGDGNGKLLFSEIQPKITGRNNQLLTVRDKEGRLNQALFLLDSNAYMSDNSGRYDYIHEDQVDWYESEIKRLEREEEKVNSMIFTHIPLQEYKEAYRLYKQGSNKVMHYFGELGEGSIAASKHKSSLFSTAVRLGSTKAIIVGHDHYNTICLGYKGIKLTYGMSIDYLAMPGIAKKTKQRGGMLITLHSNQTFDMQQIPLTSVI